MPVKQLSDGNPDGTVLGQSATDMVGLFGATPTIQRSNVQAGANVQNAVATTATTQTTPFGFSTQAQGDNLIKLVNEIRTVLVNLGAMKGS